MRTSDPDLQEFLIAKEAHMKTTYRVHLTPSGRRKEIDLWDKNKEAKSKSAKTA